MFSYLDEVNRIVKILKKEKKEDIVKQISNAKLRGGMGGEILMMICSLLKVYEISNPELFELIKTHAEKLYQYAESISGWNHFDEAITNFIGKCIEAAGKYGGILPFEGPFIRGSIWRTLHIRICTI